jgi:hypothetical protein
MVINPSAHKGRRIIYSYTRVWLLILRAYESWYIAKPDPIVPPDNCKLSLINLENDG